jgi:hypothetical protein
MSIIRKEQLTNPLSASYALTASYVPNAGNVDTGSLVTTASFNSYTASINTFTASYNTGSFIGTFFGTASWAENSIFSNNSETSSYINPIFISSSAAAAGFKNTDTGSLLVTASLSSSILTFRKGDSTIFNIPFNDFDFSLNFISNVSYSIILPYSYSIDTIDNPNALTITISSSANEYITGSIINPFSTTTITVNNIGFINLNCTKLE